MTQQYLWGINAGGEKVYLAATPIENTLEFQEFMQSAKSEVDEQHYLFSRLKSSQDLEFFHNGSWYNAIQAYRGGMWLMRNRYKKGQDTRSFIKKYIERSEDTNKFRLVRYPDKSAHIGSYVLYNELDLLEETVKRVEEEKTHAQVQQSKKKKGLFGLW